MNKVKNEKVPQGFSMVLFDIKSLFTSAPLEKTIGTNLSSKEKKNYYNKE